MGKLAAQTALFNTQEYRIVVPTSEVQILPVNPLRVSVIMSVFGSGRVFVRLVSGNPLAGGITLKQDNPPWQIDYQDNGGLLSQAFWATAEVGSPTLTIWETAFHEEWIT